MIRGLEKLFPRGRRWLLLWALLSFLGFYSTGALHNHENAAAELACPVCHVASHQAIDTPSPDIAPLVVSLVLIFLLPRPQRIVQTACGIEFRPPSQAPPIITLS
jgi:hypothetical protein